MASGQLRHSLWHICLAPPGLGHGPHILQVSLGEALHVRKLCPEVFGQPGDDAAAPAFGILALQDVRPDRPVQPDQLGIDRAHRLCPGSSAPAPSEPSEDPGNHRAGQSHGRPWPSIYIWPYPHLVRGHRFRIELRPGRPERPDRAQVPETAARFAAGASNNKYGPDSSPLHRGRRAGMHVQSIQVPIGHSWRMRSTELPRQMSWLMQWTGLVPWQPAE